ncbi:MAG: hypothetical protein WC054_00880 [Candidatus Nanopelagicales bacterium]
MVRTNWIGCLIGAVICLLIAIFVPPYIPAPGGSIVMIIGYIAAVVLFILAILGLVRGRGV